MPDTVGVRATQVARWRLTSISDADGFFEDDPTLGGNPRAVPLQRVLASPAQGLISVTEFSIGSSELELRTLPAAWDPALLVPRVERYPGESDLSLGLKPPTSFAVGPFFAGWASNIWSQSTITLDQGTMNGQHLSERDTRAPRGPRGSGELPWCNRGQIAASA